MSKRVRKAVWTSIAIGHAVVIVLAIFIAGDTFGTQRIEKVDLSNVMQIRSEWTMAPMTDLTLRPANEGCQVGEQKAFY